MMSLLLHVVFTAFFALAIALACRSGGFRPAVCHALWLVVLLKLMVPPIVTWPWALPELSQVATGRFVEVAQTTTTKPAAHEAIAVPKTTPAAMPAPIATPAAVLRIVPTLLLTAWGLGSLFVLSLHVLRIQRFRTLLKDAVPVPAWLQQEADNLARTFGIRPPEVITAPGLISAFVWNPWRARILVSTELLEQITPDAWTGILSHEMGHLRRRDLWVGCLELVAVCVWWWNPVLSYVRRQLHIYAELACDAWVLWVQPQHSQEYAETLFRIVSSETIRPSSVPAFGMASGPAAIFRLRLAMISRGPAACRLPRKALVALGAILLAALPSLSPPVAAAKNAPAPIVFNKSASPETTAGADATLEMRLYCVQGDVNIPEMPEMPKPEYARNQVPQFELDGVFTEVLSSEKVSIGGLRLTMEGPSLLWNGKDEPVSRKVVHMASPVFSLRKKDSVLVSAAAPVQAMKWLKVKKPYVLNLTAVPTEDAVRLWITLGPNEKKPGSPSAPWTNVVLGTPLNKWNGLLMNVYGEGNGRMKFLMFWKRTPVDPSAPPKGLPGPANGEYTVEHVISKGEQEDSKLTFRIEMKEIEAPAHLIDKTVMGMARLPGATVIPSDLRIYQFPASDLPNLLEGLDKEGSGELITGPGMTFSADGHGKIVLRNLQCPSMRIGDIRETLDAFSPALSAFLGPNKSSGSFLNGNSLIMDMQIESFPDADGRLLEISSGNAFAISADPKSQGDIISIHLFHDRREFVRHYRGHLFWKKELPPDVVEITADVKMDFHMGEDICFITKSPLNAQKLRLIFVELTRVSDKGERFFEVGHPQTEKK